MVTQFRLKTLIVDIIINLFPTHSFESNNTRKFKVSLTPWLYNDLITQIKEDAIKSGLVISSNSNISNESIDNNGNIQTIILPYIGELNLDINENNQFSITQIED